MSDVQGAPTLRKWPFYFADLVLSAIAAYVLWRLGVIQGATHVVISIACLLAAGWGAWLSITPWLIEYRTRSSLSESANLKSALQQIQNLEKVAELIRQANSQWQAVQDASGRTVTAAREISDKMKIETDEFMKFIENAHDQERSGLRLEVEKLRKMEGDWIKVAVQMLDHTFALFRAAERSGQQTLILQLGQFQNACREVGRRMGLVPFVPVPGEKYDPRGHQLPEEPGAIEENATIAEVLATGFTYQGHLLRRALVLLSQTAAQSEDRAEPSAENPPTDNADETDPVQTAPEQDPVAEREVHPVEARPRSRPEKQPEAGSQNELPLV